MLGESLFFRPFNTPQSSWADELRNRHYVAFVRRTTPEDGEEAWVLYNDEKVVKAVDVDEMKKFAYVYFFSRL